MQLQVLIFIFTDMIIIHKKIRKIKTNKRSWLVLSWKTTKLTNKLAIKR